MNTTKKAFLTAVIALTGLAGLSTSHAQLYTQTNGVLGDLFLGFETTGGGGSKDLLFDLGSVTNTSVLDSLNVNLNSELISVFGTNYASTVSYGLYSVTSGKTIYASAPSTNTQGYLLESGGAAGVQKQDFANLLSTFNIDGNPTSSNHTTTHGVYELVSETYSWGSFTPASGAFDNANYANIEVPVGSTAALFAQPLNTQGGNGTNDGLDFSISTNGVLTASDTSSNTNTAPPFLLQLPPFPQQAGSVVGWGEGQSNIPSSLTNIVEVSAGGDFGLALQSNGTVSAWGDNTNGGVTNVPANLTNVLQIAAGDSFALALQTNGSNGSVVAWGDNTSGQTTIPAGLTNVVQIAAGVNFALALQNNGTVVAWGDNTSGQTNIPVGLTNVTQIAAGEDFALALQSNGVITVWGDTNFGQASVPAGLTNVIQISAGGDYALALQSNGVVVVWGSNTNGITLPAGLINIDELSAGSDFALALQNNGLVTASGNNSVGQTNIPVGLTNVIDISAFEEGALAVVASPSPTPTPTPTPRPTPTVTPKLTFAKASVSEVFGAPSVSDAAKSASSGVITYSSSNTKVATVDTNGVISFVGVGSATITATQAQSGIYRAAIKTATVKVTAAKPSLTFGTPSLTEVFGAMPISDPASSGSSGTITYKSSNAKVATVDTNGVVSFIGVGSATITATQAAAPNYLAATKTATVTVTAALPAIGALTIPTSEVVGTKFSITDPTSTSTGAFSYKSNNTKVATVTGKVIKFLKAGTTTITATQAAHGNYLAGMTIPVQVNVESTP